MTITIIVLVHLFIAAIITSLVLWAELREINNELAKVREQHKKSEKTSRSVIKGQISEQLFPLVIDCPYHSADMKFFGQPFDYLVLKGYNDGNITEVVFVEIKTGRSSLSAVQRSLRDCIEQKRVSWDTVRIKESYVPRAGETSQERGGEET